MEIRIDDDGNLDEIVARNSTVQLEKLDDGKWFLLIHDSDGFEVLVDCFGSMELVSMPDPQRGLTTHEADKPHTCPVCGGDGKVGRYQNRKRLCLKCDGTGQV